MSAALALAIFVIAFVLIATERVDKVRVVLTAAAAMAVFGLIPGAGVFYSEHEGIDWNVIFLLLGMMIIVAVIKQTGVFDYLAIWSAKRAKGNPYRLMVMLMGSPRSRRRSSTTSPRSCWSHRSPSSSAAGCASPPSHT